MSKHSPLHKRAMSGIISREVTDWYGTPLQASYFVKSTLATPPPEAGSAENPPVILVPGGFDPKKGEFSEHLIRTFLEKEQVPAVYEMHYRFEDQDGYAEPDPLVEDVKAIGLCGVNRPVFVGLCGACPLLFEGILAAMEEHPVPPVGAVLMIGPFVAGHLNTLGKTVVGATANPKMKLLMKYLTYCGHSHTPGNAHRVTDWCLRTRLNNALRDTSTKDTSKTDFPVYFEALYFQLDILTKTARKSLAAVFNMSTHPKHIPGYHTALRKSPAADDLIVDFYQRALVRLKDTALSPE